MFINGQFVPSSSGRRYETFNPATEEVWMHFQHLFLQLSGLRPPHMRICAEFRESR